MTSKISKIIIALTIGIVGINTFHALPTFASGGICNTDASAEVKEAAGCGNNQTLDNALASIIKGIILILGIVAVIFIVVGGVNYMTSNGDAAKTKKAKDTILYACIGLIICALAFAIVNFVIGNVLKQGSSGGGGNSSQQSDNDEDDEGDDEDDEESYIKTLIQNDIAFFKK